MREVGHEKVNVIREVVRESKILQMSFMEGPKGKVIMSKFIMW